MSISMCMCMCMYGLVSGERDYTVRRNGCTRAREYGSTCVRRAFGRSPSPPPRRCRRQPRRRCRPAARAHPCHRARRPEARVRSAARAAAVERAPRCRSSPRASKRGAPSAAGAAGGARYDASQAEPRRRRGRSRSLPRARRSPPIRTRPWRPLRPARTLLSLPEVALKRRGESRAREAPHQRTCRAELVVAPRHAGASVPTR